MKLVNIDGENYLMYEDNEGEFFLIPAIRLDVADDELKSKAIKAYYKN